MHLQHLAFAFIAGGLLTYLCVTFLGSTGTFIARRTPSLCSGHSIIWSAFSVLTCLLCIQ